MNLWVQIELNQRVRIGECNEFMSTDRTKPKCKKRECNEFMSTDWTKPKSKNRRVQWIYEYR